MTETRRIKQDGNTYEMKWDMHYLPSTVQGRDWEFRGIRPKRRDG